VKRSALPLAFNDVAGLLSRWIESSFDGPVHLVGNSLGGHTAIHLAARRPDLVRSLTLVNTTGIPFEPAVGPHIENLIIPRGALSFTRILARDAFRSGPASMAMAFAHVLRDDARPLLRSLRVPTLLLWGETDPLVPLTYAQQILELVPRARLSIVPRAGHIPFWENPEAFNRDLLNFLREVDRAPVRPHPLQDSFSWSISGVVNQIAHREAGSRRDVVLVHGLGLSSDYLERLARALFDRGRHPIAPDLPGFGKSPDAPPRSPEEHAQALIGWADALKIHDAMWIGHSLGGNVVAHVARLRPDLVRAPVYVGPLWTKSRHPILHFIRTLALDAFREPFSLYTYVIPSYWRTGFRKWWKTLRRSLSDVRETPPEGVMIAGERDPIPDRATITNIVSVPGAHACAFSEPAEVAETVCSTAGLGPQASGLGPDHPQSEARGLMSPPATSPPVRSR